MKREFNYPDTSVGSGRPTAGWKRGMSLVEVMVVAVIMVIVTGAALTLFKITATYEARQQEVLTQTQNLRAALYSVSRDVRMAGSGLPMIGTPVIHVYVDPALADGDTQRGTGWFRYKGEDEYGVRAIMGTNSDGNATAEERLKADTLTIFRTELESTTHMGQLSSPFTPGSDNQLILRDPVKEGEIFSADDILAVAGGGQAVIVQVSVSGGDLGQSLSTLRLGPRFKPAETMTGLSFPAGSMVYNLRDVTFVTYYVDSANNRLMANYHDVTLVDEDADDPAKKNLVTVADNIEDFQVAYFLVNNSTPGQVPTPDINLSLLDQGNVVRAVQVAMVSRSKNRSQVDPPDSAPIAVLGHTAKDEKGYVRRVLSETVRLRNF